MKSLQSNPLRAAIGYRDDGIEAAHAFPRAFH